MKRAEEWMQVVALEISAALQTGDDERPSVALLDAIRRIQADAIETSPKCQFDVELGPVAKALSSLAEAHAKTVEFVGREGDMLKQMLDLLASGKAT